MFFDWLLDTSNFPLRSHCCINSPWSFWFSFFFGLGGFLIGTAYGAIPFVLMKIYYKRHFEEVFGPLGRVQVLFAAFILSCGVGHILQDIMPFWYPNYRLICLWNFVTGIISWVAVLALYLADKMLGFKMDVLREKLTSDGL